MKAILLAALLFPSTLSAADKPYDGVTEIFEVWFSARLSRFDLEEATFEQAHGKLAAEWRARYPGLGFPLKLADFEESILPDEPKITLSLKDVPICEAVDLVCKAAGRKILPTEAGWIRFDRPKPSGTSWSTRGYPISSQSLAKLNIGDESSSKELITVFSRMGIELEESWMRLQVQGGQLWVLAREPQHQQFVGVCLLLENGCTITLPEKN